MSKNFTCNFSKLSAQDQSYFVDFYKAQIDYYATQGVFLEERREQRDLLNADIAKRHERLEAGEDVEKVDAELPLSGYYTQIKALEERWANDSKEFNGTMKIAINHFLPNDEVVERDGKKTKVCKAYLAYQKAVNEGKYGAFQDSCKEFLIGIGMTECSQGQISKCANRMAALIGAKKATRKYALKTGRLTQEQSNTQFRKMFLAAFCDTYLAKTGNIIGTLKEDLEEAIMNEPVE